MNRVGTLAFPGVKRKGLGGDDPSSSNTEVKETVELHLWPFLACSRVKFTFTFTFTFTGESACIAGTKRSVSVNYISA